MGKYAAKTNRSKRIPLKKDPMKKGKVIDLQDGRASMRVEIPFDPAALFEEGLEQLFADIGQTVIVSLLEDETEKIAGEKNAKNDGGTANRHGYEEGSVYVGGIKRPILRPRVRQDGHEIELKRYAALRSPQRIERSVYNRVLAKVTTRRYQNAVEDLEEGFGIQRSSVSRHWQAASAKEVERLMTRSLKELDFNVLLIDGVVLQGETIVAALGIDTEGGKHVLGIWEGGTENTDTVVSLLNDLVDRGLKKDRSYLFVLDGSKALNKGVKDIFGSKAHIQRCLVHKKRNVLSHLPQNHQKMASVRMSAAWGMTDYEEAKKALLSTIDWLEKLNLPAANSLREGLEETLTLHRLAVPSKLRLSLNSTNTIENLFSFFRDQTKRVKTWRAKNNMRRRWACTILLEAESRFRRIRHYKEMSALSSILGNLPALDKIA